MRTSRMERALKLWFPKKDVSPLLLVCSYLLWTAADYGDWPRPWRLGIWDVYNSELQDALPPTNGDMQRWVHECAAKFVAGHKT